MKVFFALIAIYSTATSWAGAYSASGAWDKYEVSVCFAPDEPNKRLLDPHTVSIDHWPSARKRDVQSWVNSEFSPERTGIHFVGFEDCNLVAPTDVVVFYGKTSGLKMFFSGGNKGFAILGKQPGLELMGYEDASSYIWLNSAGFSKSTTVHEFAHVARLQHEHERPEALLDRTCKKQKNFLVDGSRDPNFVLFESYDPQSVMNYCVVNGKDGSEKGLSEGDLALLRFLYP